MFLYEENVVFILDNGHWKKTTTGSLTVGDKILAPDGSYPKGWFHPDGSPVVLKVIDVDGGKRRIRAYPPDFIGKDAPKPQINSHKEP